jgi:MFS family permease
MMAAIKTFVNQWKFGIALLLTGLLFWADAQLWHGRGVTGALHATRHDLYVALATIFGALLGFIITAYSIIASLSQSEVLRNLNTEDRRTVFGVFTSSIYISGIAAVAALAGLVVDSAPAGNRWVEYIVLLASLWAALALVSVVFLVEELVSEVSNKN